MPFSSLDFSEKGGDRNIAELASHLFAREPPVDHRDTFLLIRSKRRRLASQGDRVTRFKTVLLPPS